MIRLAWAFIAGWLLCVYEIWRTLGGSPWHAVAVSSRKHWGMAVSLWRWRRWGQA